MGSIVRYTTTDLSHGVHTSLVRRLCPEMRSPVWVTVLPLGELRLLSRVGVKTGRGLNP